MSFEQQKTQTGRSATAIIPHFLNQVKFLSMKFLPPRLFKRGICVFEFPYVRHKEN